MARKATRTAVPRAMQVQLARVFGANSADPRKTERTASEWKVVLRKVLHELDRYVQANVDCDELHSMFIATGLFSADESLNQDDFWPGYAEGLTRVILLLLGDYPDHHRRKGGPKAKDHYSLSLMRTLQYGQSVEQRSRTLLVAGNVGLPGLRTRPRDVLMGIRQAGFGGTHADFVQWFKKKYPDEYTAVFSLRWRKACGVAACANRCANPILCRRDQARSPVTCIAIARKSAPVYLLSQPQELVAARS